MAAVEGASYWCYQCSRSVRPNAGGEVLCPVCSGGFLEEIETPAPTENLFPPYGIGAPFGETVYFGGDSNPAGGVDSGTANAGGGISQPRVHGFVDSGIAGAGGARSQPTVHGFAGFAPNSRNLPAGGNPGMLQFLEAMSAFLQQVQPQPFGGEAVADHEGRAQATESGLFNPTLVMQGTLHNFLGGGGNVEISFDNGTGVGPRMLPGNIGDYFFGPGLQQLIQHLAENDPNRYGTPPASKSAIESMPTIYISEEHLGTDYALCAVCKDEFDLGAEVRQMPCKHMYHADCILPWLTQHNSCPVCRFELPTDDPEYNQIHGTQTAPPPPPQSVTGVDENGEAGGDAGNRGFRIWGTGLTIGRPPTEVGAEQTNPEADDRSHSALPTDGAAQDGGSGGGGSRRISFQLPWPFRFNNSSSLSPAVGHSGTSVSGEANQGEMHQSAGSNLAPQIVRRGGADGDDSAEPQQEELD